MKYPIIGFSGYAGAGKTTAAYSMKVAILSRFADHIKRMASAFGLTLRQVCGDQKETPIPELGGVTPRHIMQTLGTEWGRNCIHEDVWVSLAMRDATKRMENGLPVVFDDVRFENEARMIRDLGGVVIQVERDGTEPTGETHASERPPSPDFKVQNNGDVEALAAQIAKIVGV